MPFDSLPAETTPECDEARYVREAMDLIRDKKDWVKGTLYCDGRHCMAGAIMRVMGLGDILEAPDYEDAPEPIHFSRVLPLKLREALNEAAVHRSGRFIAFWSFNDRTTTHHEDVMAVMQAAYERLRWGAGA